MIKNPDSESEDEEIFKFLKKNVDLFESEKMYKQKEDGIFYKEGEDGMHHPLLNQVV